MVPKNSNLTKRILATLIDYGIYLLFFWIYIEDFGTPDNEGGKAVTGAIAFPLVCFWVIYFVIIEGLNGATLGHHIFRLKVTGLNGQPISFKEALKRHLLDFIDIGVYGIPAIITIRNTEKHQRIGDLWAKTLVIDRNKSRQLASFKIKQ
jgi:uncharacterized RDD family membrane protein YckC